MAHAVLLQSNEGKMSFFPVWPRGKDAKFVRLRAENAFLVSGELRGGEVQPIHILSEKGRPCVFVNPWPGHHPRVLTILEFLALRHVNL